MDLLLSDIDKYFIAICCEKEHCWLTLGAIAEQQTYAMAYFGKRILNKADYGCAGRTKTLYSTVHGILTEDYIFKNACKSGETVDFTYKAFEISLDDYKTFCQHIKNARSGRYQELSPEQQQYHSCELYYPDVNGERFERIGIDNLPAPAACLKTPALDTDIERLGAADNCRHAAIDMIERFSPVGKGTMDGMSRFFNRGTTLRASFSRGEIQPKLYVLPIPPSRSNLLLTLLYQRMEKLPNLCADSEVTRRKFAALSDLYSELAHAQAESSLDEKLKSISNWEQKHHDLIDQRRFLCTWQTKTRSMVKQMCAAINNQLEEKQPLLPKVG